MSSTCSAAITKAQKLIREASKAALQEVTLDRTITGFTALADISNASNYSEEDLAVSLFGATSSCDQSKHIMDDLDQVSSELEAIIGAVSGGKGSIVEESLVRQVRFLSLCHDVLAKTTEASKLNSLSNTENSSQQVKKLANIFRQAVSKYNEARRLLGDRSTSGGAEQEAAAAFKILDLLSSRVRKGRVEFRSWACKVLDSCLVLKDHSIDVVVDPNKSLSDAFDILSLLQEPLDDNGDSTSNFDNLLVNSLTAFARDLFDRALLPMIDLNTAPVSFSNPYGHNRVERHKTPQWLWHSQNELKFTVSDSKTGKRSTYRMEWNRDDLDFDSTGASSKKSVTAEDRLNCFVGVLDHVEALLNFVQERALFGRTDLCQIIGGYLFMRLDAQSKRPKGPLLNKLISLLNDVLPSQETDLLVMIEPLPKAVNKFDQKMKDIALLNMRGDRKAPMSDFVVNLERKYAEKRRADILAEGHSILMKDYHNTIHVGDAQARTIISDEPYARESPREDPFILAHSSVSVIANEILQLCRKTLDEATSVNHIDACSPFLLYRVSRELFDLFRAVIPAQHGLAIGSIPRCASIMHNDCVFMAFNLLTLGLEYAPKFRDPTLNKTCTFVDMVPIFRQFAEETLGEIVRRQKIQLGEIMESRMADFHHSLALSEDGGGVSWSEAENGVKGAMYHIEQVGRACSPILSADIYCRVMGTLVDSVFGVLLDYVMKAQDISEPACRFINALFGSTFKCVEVFPRGEIEAKVSCGLWYKFFAVCRLMNMSLADISHALAEGFFRSVTAPELSALVKATFADSDKRNKVLLALSNSE